MKNMKVIISQINKEWRHINTIENTNFFLNKRLHPYIDTYFFHDFYKKCNNVDKISVLPLAT